MLYYLDYMIYIYLEMFIYDAMIDICRHVYICVLL